MWLGAKFLADNPQQRGLLIKLLVRFWALNGRARSLTMGRLNDAGLEFAHIFECVKLLASHPSHQQCTYILAQCKCKQKCKLNVRASGIEMNKNFAHNPLKAWCNVLYCCELYGSVESYDALCALRSPVCESILLNIVLYRAALYCVFLVRITMMSCAQWRVRAARSTSCLQPKMTNSWQLSPSFHTFCSHPISHIWKQWSRHCFSSA